MKNAAELNQKFGIQGCVSIGDKVAGYPVIHVQNRHAQASVALHGAQVFTYQPAEQRPVLWLSDDALYCEGKPIRGGIPICWPWFGPHPSNTLPAHGFARNRFWQLHLVEQLQDDSTRLVLRTKVDAQSHILWPHPFELELHITVGIALSLTLKMTHHGTKPCTISAALHSYFNVGDVSQIFIRGLENTPYIDQLQASRRSIHSGAIRFDGELDRIYQQVERDQTIHDPVFKRGIRLKSSGSTSAVVWNPWISKSASMGDFEPNGYRNMVCVETSNAADDAISLDPGESHSLAVAISIEENGSKPYK